MYAVEGGGCAHLSVRCMRLHMCVHTACVHVQQMGYIMLVPELCSWKEQTGTLGAPQCRGTVLQVFRAGKVGVWNLGEAGLGPPSQVTCSQGGERLWDVQREGGAEAKGQGGDLGWEPL